LEVKWNLEEKDTNFTDGIAMPSALTQIKKRKFLECTSCMQINTKGSQTQISQITLMESGRKEVGRMRRLETGKLRVEGLKTSSKHKTSKVEENLGVRLAFQEICGDEQDPNGGRKTEVRWGNSKCQAPKKKIPNSSTK